MLPSATRPGAAARRAARSLLSLWSAAALALGGCASAPHPGATAAVNPAGAASAAVPAREAERLRRDILADLQRRAARLHALRGRAELRLSAPAWGGASWMEAGLAAEAPARLRLRAYAGPTTLFDLAADAARFSLYLPDSRTVWGGPPEALPAVTGFPGRPAEVVSALLGQPFGTPEAVELVNADADRVTVRWRAADGGEVTARYRRRPLQAEEFRLARGDSLAAVLAYDDYLKESAGWCARRVTLTWPRDGATLVLQFRDLEWNPSLRPDAFDFTPPEGAARVEVGGAAEGRVWGGE
jgi:hypothetical protein